MLHTCGISAGGEILGIINCSLFHAIVLRNFTHVVTSSIFIEALCLGKCLSKAEDFHWKQKTPNYSWETSMFHQMSTQYLNSCAFYHKQCASDQKDVIFKIFLQV